MPGNIYNVIDTAKNCYIAFFIFNFVEYVSFQFEIFKTTLQKTETVEPEEADKPGMPKKLTAELKENLLKEFEVSV